MTSTSIYKIAVKQLPAHMDVKHYLEILFQQPENEWFKPNNSKDEIFTICFELANHHIISIMKEPIWNNGSFQGTTISFKYKK